MLERRTSPAGVVFYASPVLEKAGVPHAFSTRIGGISAPPFESLNLGNPSGCEQQDARENIDENYRRLMIAAGCPGRERCAVHQVHGNRVVRVERRRPHDISEKADALVTDDPSRAVVVRTADCVPVLLATADGRVVAAIHAGWRGVVAGAVESAIDAIRAIDANTPILAAVGPSIGPDAFEVGEEVLAEFQRVFGASPIRRREDGKGLVDLRSAIRTQLIKRAVSENNIDETDRCSVRDVGEFYSHRRDRNVTGRMAAIIAPAS